MKKKIFNIILLILWMLVIFYLSSNNGVESSNVSMEVTTTINQEIQIKDIAMMEKVIRKMAHVIEFGILVVLCFNVLKDYKVKHIYYLSFLISFLYACFDEWHQLFIDGRSGEVLDVIIDTSGIVIFLIILYYLTKKIKKT